MAIIALKAWYLEQYEPIKEIVKKPCHLRLSRNSLLKSGLRADFLDDRQVVETSDWFALYLEGETVEFYIEGSGSYVISNIDLVSQEIYFTKQDSMMGLEPIIYFSPQTEYPAATEAIITTLNEELAKLNERSRTKRANLSRFPLSVEIAPRPTDSSLRLSSSQLRKIRKSLLYIADGTPIASLPGNNKSHLLLSSNVCVEIGYAIDNKDAGQMLLLWMERPDLTGEFPFDLSQYRQLSFKDSSELTKTLPKLLKTLLQRFNLFI
jgi:hypothetical protein